jgi:formate-dependent nitrite reductase membrane component NrfD
MGRTSFRLVAYGIGVFGGHLGLLAYQQKSLSLALGGIACTVVCSGILGSLKNSKQEFDELLRIGSLIKTAGVCALSSISIVVLASLLMPEHRFFAFVLAPSFFITSVMGAVMMGYCSKQEELAKGDRT